MQNNIIDCYFAAVVLIELAGELVAAAAVLAELVGFVVLEHQLVVVHSAIAAQLAELVVEPAEAVADQHWIELAVQPVEPAVLVVQLVEVVAVGFVVPLDITSN
ncbi:hypothetical protein [Lentibacillus sp. CBA3610]|uniref:hypothetical protein n=1 Tax=Lentibacillus sp. CBA3610 TaxID=2518176 RepID=UPI00159597DE|nr:hypothetical protein [Lentibacillus sp. CBA3610]